MFGNYLKKINKNVNLFLKLYFLIGGVAIFIFFIIYTNTLIQKARKDAQIPPKIFARFVSYSTDDNFESLMINYLLEEVIGNIKNPIIVTDANKNPKYWKNIGVEENIHFDYLDEDERERVFKYLKYMNNEKNIIPITLGDKEEVINYAFYSESATLRQLRLMPYLEMSFVLLFVLFGVYGITIIKKSEKNLIWIGLAKETAHQFGTPISSLIAWSDILKTKISEQSYDESLLSMVSHMQADIEQLKKVVSRFGKVGSVIEMQPTQLDKLIEETISYFNKRLPHLSKKINILFINKIRDKVLNIDPDLIKWSLENMFRNSIDAMQLKGGNIIVIAFSKDKETSILIKDEGKGISRSMYAKIFEPGITTKSRGWGLGLSLAKRIVEDYHKGKIKVLDSIVGEGSTFEIILPED